MIFLKSYFINTSSGVDLLPITSDVRYAIRDGHGKNGLVTVVVPGPGAAVSAFESIPELIEELKIAFEIFAGEDVQGIDKRKEQVAIAPRVQAAMVGRSITLPIAESKLVLNPYEEIFLIDFEKRPKRREFIVQVFSEEPQTSGSVGAQIGASPKKR